MAFSVDDLNEMDLSTISDLPWTVKSIIIAVVCCLIIFAGFWFINRPQLDELDKTKNQELELRTEFETAQHKAANLEAYKKQLNEIRHKFGELLQKLPRKTEVPGLLEEISTAGSSSGLTFEVFKPLPEAKTDFYSELPIEIQVGGSFHQAGEFISKLSALSRIVTIHDFEITGEAANDKRNSNNNKKSLSKKGLSIQPISAPNELMMRFIAKTYRGKESD